MTAVKLLLSDTEQVDLNKNDNGYPINTAKIVDKYRGKMVPPQFVEKGSRKGWFFHTGYGIIKMVMKILKKDKKKETSWNL